MLLLLSGGLAIGLSVICVPFVSPALRKFCLPYIPATKQQMYNIFKALEGQKGTLLDIGSGDGRIVLEAARHNFQSYGVELNYWLVVYSRIQAFRCGLKAVFFRDDLWKHHLKVYDNIVVFGVEQMVVVIVKQLIVKCFNYFFFFVL